MCEGFGMLIDKELNYFFVEPDTMGNVHHSEIFRRLCIKENDKIYNRRFIRIECPHWRTAFNFDEPNTLPGWAEDKREEIQGIVNKVIKSISPAYKKFAREHTASYNKSVSESKIALDKYRAIEVPASQQFYIDNDYQRYCTTTRIPAKEYRSTLVKLNRELHNRESAILGELTKVMSLVSGYVPERS